MGVTTERSVGWVAVLAMTAGAAVLIPSLSALVVTVVAVVLRLI